MNTAAMIRRFGKLRTVTRMTADGSYSGVDGTYTPGATTDYTFQIADQPLTGDELAQATPSGEDRQRERRKVYCAQDLLANQEASLRRADKIAMDGKTFLVESVQRWNGFVKAIVAEENA